jgi:menaquinone-specific isochorismate synthase
MSDFALFRLPDGRAWLGEGPFHSAPAAPPTGMAFYWNDFDLSDPSPWKIPTSIRPITAADTDLPWSGLPCPKVHWTHPAPEYFEMAFRRIRREVIARRLEKMVPVVSERGSLLQGRWEGLIQRVLTAPKGFWGYACVQDDHGFAGATPELLFKAEGNHMETMALAGTAKPGADADFLDDVKEIEEHEIVVGYLEKQLAQLGQVTRSHRSLMQAGSLRHFQTHLSVTLAVPAEPTTLVPWLHPTPAVGCLPREQQWLDKLRHYRRLLNVPSFFGAPFGFIQDGVAHLVVSIRGVSWQGDTGFLPSGCGIVGGSAYDHEWRELRLKREAVMNLLGLARP